MFSGREAIALAMGAALSMASPAGSLAADLRSPVTMKPLAAVSLDAGGFHAVGYFLASEGQCKLTLMIAETVPEGQDESNAAPASRLRLNVQPGAKAQLDTATGQTLQFACQEGARAMVGSAVDRVALYRPGE